MSDKPNWAGFTSDFADYELGPQIGELVSLLSPPYSDCKGSSRLGGCPSKSIVLPTRHLHIRSRGDGATVKVQTRSSLEYDS
jgi:hypothetical protein